MQSLWKYLFILIALVNIIHAGDVDSIKIAKQKFVVDSIKISGNDITEDFIILRELTFQVGDSVNLEILHYNRERIYSLGLFNRVEVTKNEIDSKNSIVIDVNETWYIYPIPFWYVMNGDAKKSTYGVNFTLKNFRGRNETVRASVGIGYDSFFSIGYDNPALIFEKGIGLNFGASYYKYTNRTIEAEKKVGSKFDYKVIGVYAGAYERINQFNLVGFSLGYSYRETTAKKTKGILASNETLDRFPSLTVYYYYDSRDLKLFSDYGLYANASYSHKGFGINDISYNSFDVDLRQYLNLTESLTSKVRVDLRHTFGKLVPYYDYSFLGYSDKIRGHYQDYMEGHNSILTSLEFSHAIIREWNFSIKLPLIPQSLTSARIGIYVNTFFDAGSTFNNGERINLNNFSSGYGLGLTFLILPYNAVRLEYAFNELGKGEFVFATGFSF